MYNAIDYWGPTDGGKGTLKIHSDIIKKNLPLNRIGAGAEAIERPHRAVGQCGTIE